MQNRFQSKLRLAAAGIHPISRFLLHLLLPALIFLLCGLVVRYQFFEPHILGVCLYYRGLIEYTLLSLAIVFGGVLLVEIATRKE